MVVSTGVYPFSISETQFKGKEDADWLAFRHGDTHALETIFRKNYPLMMDYGLRFVKNRDEIDDCIQTVFLTLWERRSHIGPSTSSTFYLLASLRRILLKQITSEKKLTSIDDNDSYSDFAFSPESEMIKNQTQADLIQLLHSSIELLPARQREALHLKYYGEHSYHEIGIIMNISTRAVYKLLYKALENLQQIIQPKATKISDFLYFMFL